MACSRGPDCWSRKSVSLSKPRKDDLMKILRFILPMAWSMFAIGSLHGQVIIANSGVKATQVSKSDLAEIFTGASSNFGDGSHAVPATLKEGAAHEEFLKRYIGKKDLLFRGDWRVLVFS